MLRLTCLLLVFLCVRASAQPAKPAKPDDKRTAVEGKDIADAAAARKEARDRAAETLGKQLAESRKLLTAIAQKPTARDYDEDTNTLTLQVALGVPAEKWKPFVKDFVAAAE